MSLSVKMARSQSAGRGMPGVGDPGIFGTIGSFVSKIAGVAKKVPGPIGWAGTAVSAGIQALRPAAPPAIPFGRPGSVIPGAPRPIAPSYGPPVGQMLPLTVAGVSAPAIDPPPIGAPSGYHVNETSYFLKDGTFIPEGSRWVKNRRRNPLNPAAASKAVARIESLKRATKRFSHITIRKKCCQK